VDESPATDALLSAAGRAAVAAGEAGKVIKLARQALGWKQQDLAERSGYSQPTISRLERGLGRACRDTAILSDLAATLGLPVEALGLVRSAGPRPSLDDVDRRNFLGSAVALAAAALLPQAVAEPARIGADDVARCWVSLRRLFELDDRQGGSTVYAMAAGMACRLQDAMSRGSYSPSVGAGLSQATAATMEHAGWLAYDAGRHDDARRWWLETCHLAEMYAVPDARVTALTSMSLHASTTGRGKEAADLARAARAAAGDRATPVLLSLLSAREAVGLAQARDAAGATTAIVEARRRLDVGRQGDEPLWLEFWNPADLACHETRVSLALGRGKAAESCARSALASADPSAFPRNHAIYTVRLGAVLTHLGQLDEAIAVTTSAVRNADLLSGSRRISADLRRTVDVLGQQPYAPARTFATAAQRLLAAA
jgi:transcriptional regulator with XRE-family HTH domain